TFFRDNPEDCGLFPDGDADDDPDDTGISPESSFTLWQAVQTYAFWVFNLALALHGMFVTAMTFHIESIFRQAGLSEDVAFAIFFPMSVIAVSSGLCCGWLLDRAKLKFFLLGKAAGLILALCGLLALGTGVGFYMLVAGAGLARGIFGLLMSATWPRLFGRKHLGAITGFQRTWMVSFTAAGPLLFSLSKDLVGGYHGAVMLTLAAGVALFLCGLFADKPPEPAADAA
ncbi:MAG: MFS transporter, partial [Planctomycetota bacterium]